ncbi:zinc finger MYM-type protein 1-like, partial [Myzus persicae]|uniref:zinc finger MYM-type protein 1-like n=1 Tax=Myzus persicae TaxID=13164 RepID=UPI000B933893
ENKSVSSDIHPLDPKVEVPKNQIEFKQRILKGPFQPILDIYPRTLFSGTLRSFQKSWYQQFTWLEYSPEEDLAFCFPCRMFIGSIVLNVGQSELVYSKLGYKNWKAATSKFSLHEKTKNHLNSSTSLMNFLNSKPIDVSLDNQIKSIHSQKELTRQKNTEIMKRLIDITLCLGFGGKPFRGHTENKNDIHKGLFLDIVGLLRKYDPIFNEHFISGPKNAMYTSNHIQNDLISSINLVIKRQLKDMILNEKVSLIADETSDIGHHEQLSIVLRYFNKQTKCPVEQFVCMKRIKAVDAQTIFSSLSDIIHEYNIKWENIVSVCFDGAASMAGCTTGVQAKFKEKNINTFFVHCYGHCLNLVLVDSVGSCVRHAVLEKIANTINLKLKTLKSVSTTRWACRYEAVSAVKENYPALLIAIKDISESTRQADVRAKGLGIIHQMQTFEFVFALEMLDPILCSILK